MAASATQITAMSGNVFRDNSLQNINQNMLANVIKNVYNTSVLKFGLYDNIVSEDILTKICNNNNQDIMHPLFASGVEGHGSNACHPHKSKHCLAPFIGNSLAPLPSISHLREFDIELQSLINTTRDMLDIFVKLEQECVTRMHDLASLDCFTLENELTGANKQNLNWADESCKQEDDKQLRKQSMKTIERQINNMQQRISIFTDQSCSKSKASDVHSTSKSYALMLTNDNTSSISQARSDQDKQINMLACNNNSNLSQVHRRSLSPKNLVCDNAKGVCQSDLNVSPTPEQKYKHIEVANIGINLPIVTKLEDMKPAFVWYEPEKKIYMCLASGFYAEVPFPDSTDISTGGDRTGTVPCKHGDAEKCLKQREYAASKYNSTVRACNFAHFGDILTKVGIPARCPNLPRLGQHSTLKHDIKKVVPYDIRTVLLYGLSDTLLGLMWHQHASLNNPDPLIFKDLEICQ